MWHWWKELDRILRGEATRTSALKRGTVEIPAAEIAVVLVPLAMLYGVCMGCFALFKDGGPQVWQVIASMVKVPLLFALTMVVTFPSLYVFNALVGSRLTLTSILRLLVAALAVTVAVLASLGTIVAFFSVSTNSYDFMVLLNVVAFGVSGFLGMAFLLQTLHRLSLIRPEPIVATTEIVGEEKTDTPEVIELGPLDATEGQVLSKHVKTIFRCWIVLFALVGSQMGFVLRPFIGNPAIPFTWFRHRESSFFEAVWHTIVDLFS